MVGRRAFTGSGAERKDGSAAESAWQAIIAETGRRPRQIGEQPVRRLGAAERGHRRLAGEIRRGRVRRIATRLNIPVRKHIVCSIMAARKLRAKARGYLYIP